MKKNTIPTNNLFLELDDIDNFKDLSKLSSSSNAYCTIVIDFMTLANAPCLCGF